MNFTLGIWYMSVAEQLWVCVLIATVACAIGVVGGLMAYLAEDSKLVETTAYKFIVGGLFVFGTLTAVIPQTPAHAAFLIQGQIAVAEAEGRPVPKLSTAQQNAIDNLVKLYANVETTKASATLVEAEKELKRKQD